MSNHHVIREYVVNEVHKPVSLLSGVELSGLTNLLYYMNHPRYSSILPQTAETGRKLDKIVHEFLKTREDMDPLKDLLVLLEVKHVHPEEKRTLGV